MCTLIFFLTRDSIVLCSLTDPPLTITVLIQVSMVYYTPVKKCNIMEHNEGFQLMAIFRHIYLCKFKESVRKVGGVLRARIHLKFAEGFSIDWWMSTQHSILHKPLILNSIVVFYIFWLPWKRIFIMLHHMYTMILLLGIINASVLYLWCTGNTESIWFITMIPTRNS